MNDCLLYIKIKTAAVFLSFHIKQNQALSVSPHCDTVSHIFITPHESFKDCFLRKKVAEFVCFLHIASLMQLL